MANGKLENLLEQFIRERAVDVPEKDQYKKLREQQFELVDLIAESIPKEHFAKLLDLEFLMGNIESEASEAGYRRGFNDCIKCICYWLKLDLDRIKCVLEGGLRSEQN